MIRANRNNGLPVCEWDGHPALLDSLSLYPLRDRDGRPEMWALMCHYHAGMAISATAENYTIGLLRPTRTVFEESDN